MEHAGVLVIVLLLLLASVSGKTTTRIAGGNQTEIENFPHQVAIVKTGTTKLRCGGALIRSNYVLTSAYCASLGNSSDTQVIVGNTYLTRESPSHVVGVEDIRIHERYDTEGRKNDIALLKLNTDLRIQQENVDTITIRQNALDVTAICSLTGWGSGVWNGEPSPVLQRVELYVVNRVLCVWLLEQTAEAAQFCGRGKEGENGCFLDEGDPLVCDGELAGIMSHSPNCGKNNKPSIYTDVYEYKDWIEATIASTNSASVTSLSSFITIAMPISLLSYWKSRA